MMTLTDIQVPMADSIAAFLHTLRRSQLLGTAELNEVKAKLLNDLRDPRSLADRLIERGWLTPYEAERLLEGHDQELALGTYRLLYPLGEGGLCQVFKAWDTTRQGPVALKVVHPEFRSNAEVLDQLRQEMQILGRLDHPCFVKTFDVEANTARHFFAMEYVAGLDLSKLVQKAGPLPMGQACEYIRQVAAGMQYAYEKGLVHRDVKPANLLAPVHGSQVRILDIGIARLEWAYKDLTTTATPTQQGGALMGTPDYIAPEQALNPQLANIRADIYSLGCTLYHLLTGQPPFPGKSLTQKLLHHQQTPAPSVRGLRPELPQELAAVVQKMMAKAPGDRYQTPAGVSVALVRFCRGVGARLSIEQYCPPRGNDFMLARAAAGLDEKHAAPTSAGNRAKTKPVPVVAAAPAVPATAKQGGKERRGAVRRAGNPVSVVVTSAGGRGETLSGWVLNRSSSGLGLLVDEALEVGTVVTVQPTKSNPGPRPIPVRIMYCIPERASWRVGCQFVDKPSYEELRLFG
jgi:serine/threonine protein kinase